MLQRFDQGSAKAFAAVQREIAVGAAVQVGEFARAQGFAQQVDARMVWKPAQHVWCGVAQAVDFEDEVRMTVAVGKLHKK